jgi:hypothetical protein
VAAKLLRGVFVVFVFVVDDEVCCSKVLKRKRKGLAVEKAKKVGPGRVSDNDINSITSRKSPIGCTCDNLPASLQCYMLHADISKLQMAVYPPSPLSALLNATGSEGSLSTFNSPAASNEATPSFINTCMKWRS